MGNEKRIYIQIVKKSGKKFRITILNGRTNDKADDKTNIIDNTSIFRAFYICGERGEASEKLHMKNRADNIDDDRTKK